MSIIEQIKAEVERRKKKAEHYIEVCKADSRAFEYWSGERDVLELFEREFLSTLQEKSEKPINPQPVKKNPLFDSCLAKVNPETREEVRRNIDKMTEQPVCEGFEEEYKNYVENDPVYSTLVNGIVGRSIARHFYELGRQSKPKVSEDLETEVERCVYEPFFDLDGVAVKGATHYLTVEDVADIARHFAQWQKEQMIRSAVEGEIVGSVGTKQWVESNYLDNNIGKPGDKVRIVFVKEEGK